MKQVLRRILTGALCAALVLPTCAASGTWQEKEAKAAEAQPDFRWTFENVQGTEAANEGTVADAKAELKGTAKVDTQAIEISGKKYSADTNHVLTLSGGSKGSSYVSLPKELYKGVSQDTGITWSFWMKPDNSIASYSRLFSSADSQNKNEFAFAPYAQDSVWNLIFDDGANYKQIFESEPAKGAWTLMTITVSGDDVQFYANGLPIASTCGGGDSAILQNRLDALPDFVNHALGMTCSTWSDPDCVIQLDDVSLYHKVLTAAEVKSIAQGYGLDATEQAAPSQTEEVSGDDASEGLTEVEDLKTTSVDGSNVVRIWKDASNKYYYSANRKNEVLLQCAPIGIRTKKADLSKGLELQSVVKKEGTEEYDWLQGSSSHVSKKYNETAFTLTTGASRITMIFRVFDDGMAYRYEVDEDTGSETEVSEVTKEESSFQLPDAANMWSMNPSVTYEASNYSSRKVANIKKTAGKLSTPILGRVPTNAGNKWVLLTEANVYNEKDPYCACVFYTEQGSTALQVKFGSYLVQETDDSLDGKTYSPNYKDIASVTMNNKFHTPWRVAVMTDTLEDLANTSLISDLNPQAEGDFSWVEPGTSSWSWWSTSSDAIDYDTMYDYIDYALETGQKYCLVDFGWEVWKDYETKIKDLVAYAEPKGVKLILWYGVNKFDQKHKFDLDNPETIEQEFAWCEKLGVKGVKVDYINSDSQFAMKVMYDLASIAAKHKLILNYHGCTDPNGENRTFPNILSSEAVMGSEYFKWGSGSPVQSLLVLPYARNVIGSMEFTPVGMSVKNVSATDGFMLAMPVVYESAIQTLAHSAYVYPGYGGTSLLAGIPSSWDESKLVLGEPGSSVVRARRKGENWYLGAMTSKEETYEVPLKFLDSGETYYAYIYTDKPGGGIEENTQLVTSETVLTFNLKKAGGCAVKFSKNDPLTTTIYDGYKYYEAEDAQLGAGTSVKETDYCSGKKYVANVGGKADRTVTFNVDVAEAGEHDCNVYVVAPNAKDLFVQANEEAPVELSKVVGVAGDSNAVSSKAIKLNLKAGSNTIRLFNDSAAGPGIDRIAVSKSDISNAQVALEQESYEYDGQRHTPKVTVTRNGVEMAEGTEYQVFYANCVKAGTAEVTVVGTGDYAGTVKKEYKIVDNSVPAPVATSQASTQPAVTQTPQITPEPTAPSKEQNTVAKPGKVKGVSVKSKKKKAVTVTYKKLKNVKGYQIQISYNTNKKSKKVKTVSVKSSVSKKTIGKLKSKRIYYIRVRAYSVSEGKKVYGSWSAMKKVKVK